MSTKALSIFFCFVTLLNIPVFIFFSQGNKSSNSIMNSLFGTLSLGNIGEGGNSCGQVEISTGSSLSVDLECFSGTIGPLV